MPNLDKKLSFCFEMSRNFQNCQHVLSEKSRVRKNPFYDQSRDTTKMPKVETLIEKFLKSN